MTICSVRQLYVLYILKTGRILGVPNLVHTLNHISPKIHRVYLVYTDYTLFTSATRHSPGRILGVLNLLHALDHITPMLHRIYLVFTDNTLCTSAIRHTPGRILRLANLVLTLDHIPPMIHRYTWCTRTICCVRQPYVLYRSHTSLFVSHTSGTSRILGVPKLVHTLDHISPIIHRYTWCTRIICCVRQPYVLYIRPYVHISSMIHKYTWCTRTICCERRPYVLYRSHTSLYVSHTSGTSRILRVPNLVLT